MLPKWENSSLSLSFSFHHKTCSFVWIYQPNLVNICGELLGESSLTFGHTPTGKLPAECRSYMYEPTGSASGLSGLMIRMHVILDAFF